MREKISRLEQLRGSGDHPTGKLGKWVDSIEAKWRDRLVRAGLLDGCRLLMTKPLAYHLIGFGPLGSCHTVWP